MDLEQIIPVIALVAILIFIFPNFIRTNNQKKIFFKNLGIWGIIVISLVILLHLIF